MMLEDLKKSISDMTTEELHAELTALRTRRHRSTNPPAKTVKTTSLLKANLDAIGETGLASLLSILEGKVATKNNPT